MQNLPQATPSPPTTSSSTTSQEGKWSRTRRQKMEKPHHLAFPLLTDVGGSHRGDSVTGSQGWVRNSLVDAIELPMQIFLGLLCYHRVNTLNPKALLAHKKSCVWLFWGAEGRLLARSLRNLNSCHGSFLLCQLLLAFCLPPKSISHPRTPPSAEKYPHCDSSFHFISYSLPLISLPWALLKHPSFEGVRNSLDSLKLVAFLVLNQPVLWGSGLRTCWKLIARCQPWAQSLQTLGKETRHRQLLTRHQVPGSWAVIYCYTCSLGDSGTCSTCLEKARRSVWPGWNEWEKERWEVRSDRYRDQIT